jgi:vancomycin resistance protein YoaR
MPEQIKQSGGSYRSIPCLLLAFLLTALLLFPFLAVLAYEAFYMHRIHPGVSVGGVAMGGLTLGEAEAKLGQEFEGYSERKVVFRYGGRIWFASAQELGVTHDSRLTSEAAYRVGRTGSVWESLKMQAEALLHGYPVRAVQGFDEGVAIMQLSKLAMEINRPARDARLRADNFEIAEEPEQIGRELDIPATKAALKASLANLSDEPVHLVVRQIEPSVIDLETARVQAANILSQPLIFTLREQTFISGTLTPQMVEKRWMLDQAAIASIMIPRQVKNPDGKVSLTMGLDLAQLTPYVEQLAQQIDRPARDAQLDFDPETGQLTPRVMSQEGYILDVTKTLALANAKAVTTDHLVPLPVDVLRPAVAVENIPQMGIKELIGEATTHFKGSSAARIRNIQVAASRFDGAIIAPGEVFSFNKYLGDVSAAMGYEESQIIWGNRTAIGIGGGVCQVSTTAFRAAFWAGLPILERYNHGYRVSWYEPPVGLDATVYAPTVDLKLKNDMASYILIKTETDPEEATVTFRFYGTDQGRVVEMSGPVQSNEVPHGPPVYKDDSTLPLGTKKQVEWPHDGMDTTIQRSVFEDGMIIHEDRFFSRYAPWPAMYLLGTEDGTTAGGAEVE